MKKIILSFALVLGLFSLAFAQENSESDTTIVYTLVDTMPTVTIKGEDMAMEEVVQRRVKKFLKKNKYKGSRTVYVTSVIDVDGNISKIKVLRSVSPELDALAIRFVNELPRFNPASHNGVRVPVQLNIPIKF